jgi:hypothetical protein
MYSAISQLYFNVKLVFTNTILLAVLPFIDKNSTLKPPVTNWLQVARLVTYCKYLNAQSPAYASRALHMLAI